jgi:hypothetical protein
MHLVQFGSHLVQFGPIWSNLARSYGLGPIWFNLVQFGTWSNALGLIWHALKDLVQFGPNKDCWTLLGGHRKDAIAVVQGIV